MQFPNRKEYDATLTRAQEIAVARLVAEGLRQAAGENVHDIPLTLVKEAHTTLVAAGWEAIHPSFIIVQMAKLMAESKWSALVQLQGMEEVDRRNGALGDAQDDFPRWA